MRSDLRLPSAIRRFADALPLGLGAASLFFGGLLPKPRFERYGTDADWESVGHDLTEALAAGGHAD